MSRRTTPLQDAINHILARRDKNSMLEIKFINSVKGRGIFTLANFKQGDFVVEYRGELIDATEAEHRRNLYPSACSVFMFEFIWKQKTLCIDGALEDGSFGRLVNDEHRTPNCRMKLIEAEGKPHLCLFALKEIAAGSEITYDYGGKEWPWRKKLKIASIPSGQQCVAEPIAHDVEHHVISTDSFTDRELRAECQSSRPTADNSEHEVHSVGGQCGTSSLKELIGEVGVQYQELSPQAFSEELTSESKSKEVPQSSRAVPNDSACECTIHRLVFESVKLDKCGICHSPLTAIRWHGLRCKQCRCVWHKICLQTSSEDWDMSDGDVSSDEEYIPNSASDSESSGTELSIELPGPSKNSHAASMPDLCIATISQVMNLKDNELDQLADFLGHDIRVHREYYRLPQSTIQLAKISKLLMAMEKGSVKDIQGKTLDEIGDDIDGMATGSQQLPDASTLRVLPLRNHGGI
ncbi:alpha-tectorin [Sarotherodon galilaeus]